MQTPTPKTDSSAAISALLARAHAALAMEHPESRSNYISHWEGYAKALTDLLNGVGDRLAAKDAASGGYVQGGGKAAWSRLTVGLELLTTTQIVERFAAEGFQMTPEAATQLQLEAVQQLPHGVVPAVHLDDEHAAPPIDVGDGSGLHTDSVVEGGTA